MPWHTFWGGLTGVSKHYLNKELVVLTFTLPKGGEFYASW